MMKNLIMPESRNGGPFRSFEDRNCFEIAKNVDGAPFGDIKKLFKKNQNSEF